uniref:Ubiquitin-like domain-containing protein n=1 Tax=Oryza barthii TaxID=65489 RepID=A0A0D3H861_9ORYZ
MDVTFVCAGEESFKMEVGFFDTVHDIKQKLQSRRGWPAAALEERAFPLPRDGAYFFIHRQSVMDESRSFEWHGVAAGDEVVVFEGSVTRPPTY